MERPYRTSALGKIASSPAKGLGVLRKDTAGSATRGRPDALPFTLPFDRFAIMPPMPTPRTSGARQSKAPILSKPSNDLSRSVKGIMSSLRFSSSGKGRPVGKGGLGVTWNRSF